MHVGRGGEAGGVFDREAREREHRLATPVREPTARLLDHEPRGGEVPDPALLLHVGVEAPAGDVHELDHRAPKGADPGAVLLQGAEEPEVFGAAEPLCTVDGGVVAASRGDAEAPPVAGGAESACGGIERLFGGGPDGRHHGTAAFQQGDGDRVLRQAVRVVAGAVDGVDAPHETALEVRGRRLLTEEPCSRHQVGKAAAQPAFGGEVDSRHEVAGALPAHVAAAGLGAPSLDHGGGTRHRARECCAETAESARCEVGSGHCGRFARHARNTRGTGRSGRYNARMRTRIASLLLGCAAVACATDAGDPVPSVPAAPSLLEPAREPAASGASKAEPVEAPGERAVREELARGADPEEAALQLAVGLAARERYHDALAAVEAALERRPSDGRLLVARAGLLRDLGMRAEAARVLAGLRAEHGAGAMHPGILLELAELQWLEGEPAAALATIVEMQQVHGSDPWVAGREDAIATLEAEVRAEPRPRTVKLRDVLGNLRGAPEPAERIAALRRLLEVGGEVAVRAVATGVVDEDPAVRQLALERAELEPEALLELGAAMLLDPARTVRATAAARLGASGQPGATGPLLGALGVEEDEATFAALVRGLLALYPNGPALDPAGYGSAARRMETAAAWNRHCNR